MRETQFPLDSLGSKKPESPSAEDLVSWIAAHRGKNADLTTWEIETALQSQKPVTEPCAGGEFFEDRMFHAFEITDCRLENEFGKEFSGITEDISAALKIRKHIRWAIPVSAKLTDAYFKDEAIFEESYADALAGLCRYMRDLGIEGHILAGKPSEILLESLSGRKYLWVTGPEEFETVLEVSHTLVCGPEDIGQVEDLNDSYDIRTVIVKDGDSKAMERLLETFDADNLRIAGIGPSSKQEEYWDALSKVKARLTDI